jgi:hypothetical protein
MKTAILVTLSIIVLIVLLTLATTISQAGKPPVDNWLTPPRPPAHIVLPTPLPPPRYRPTPVWPKSRRAALVCEQ